MLQGRTMCLANLPFSLPASGTDATIDLWKVLLSGGFFMLPLVALLFVGTLLVIIYFFTLRRGNIVTRRYLDIAESLLKKRDYFALAEVSSHNGQAVAQVFYRALAFATKNPQASIDNIREIAETEALRQANTLNHRITYLADVGTIAPMVGLLGTVSGMIKSFSSLANDVATSKAMLLSQGVSEALVCTASGLVIGIAAFSFYAYFRGRVQRLIADLEAASTQIMTLLEMYYTPDRGSLKTASF